MTDPLARFSPPTREWFASVFAAPTAVQAEAWRAIADGEHALVVAPTGSGKTLAAFLWAIDALAGSTDRRETLRHGPGASRRGPAQRAEPPSHDLAQRAQQTLLEPGASTKSTATASKGR